MSTLYVFGDSFTTPNFCVNVQDSHWGLLARDLQVDSIINYSYSGFSFDQLIHVLCNEKLDFNDSYFFIGVPPIERIALYNKNKKWYRAEFDKEFTAQRTLIESINDTEQFEFFEAFKDAKFFLANYSFRWQQQTVCDKIFMMYHWLKSINVKFVVVNLTAPMYYHGTRVEQNLKASKECILFDNTCHSINEADNIKPADWDQGVGWHGHHGAEGCLNWYTKVLKPKVIELGWL
jgi:hypothetical protein